MAVDYEWCCEVVDEHGDIVNGYHSDTFDGVAGWAWDGAEDGLVCQICLVRTASNGDRAWAYMTNGQLPEYFWDSAGHDTTRVPQRFHSEVERV